MIDLIDPLRSMALAETCRYPCTVRTAPAINQDVIAVYLSGYRDGEMCTVVVSISGMQLLQYGAADGVAIMLRQGMSELELNLDRLPIRQALSDAAKLLARLQ